MMHTCLRRSLVYLGALAALSAAQAARADDTRYETATFAGGCFWCMEAPFDALPGVTKTISGYTGGLTKDPTYDQVSDGATGHTESVQITYDPAKISYEQLLEVFWKNIDPTDRSGQFCDKGSQYRSAVFTHNQQQRELAEQSKKRIEAEKKFPEPIVTPIVDAVTFYPAEEYHQDYYKKNPVRYKWYRTGCGRDRRLRELWGER